MTDDLTLTMRALADPTRRKILAWLAVRQATVRQITDRLPISQPAVSRHLKILEEAGLIERHKDATKRWCRLRSAPLRDVMAFAGGFENYRRESYDRLDDLLKGEMRRTRRSERK